MASTWVSNQRPKGLLALLGASLLLLAGCGGGSSSTGPSTSNTAERSTSSAATVAKTSTRPSCGPPTKSMIFTGRPGAKNAGEPSLRSPCGPPPKKLFIKDFKKGTGRAAAIGDEVRARYAGAEYGSTEVTYGSWVYPAISFKLGAKERSTDIETGLLGMKAGGRRELIVPPALTEGHGTLVYVVDLVKVEPG